MNDSLYIDLKPLLAPMTDSEVAQRLKRAQTILRSTLIDYVFGQPDLPLDVEQAIFDTRTKELIFYHWKQETGALLVHVGAAMEVAAALQIPSASITPMLIDKLNFAMSARINDVDVPSVEARERIIHLLRGHLGQAQNLEDIVIYRRYRLVKSVLEIDCEVKRARDPR